MSRQTHLHLLLADKVGHLIQSGATERIISQVHRCARRVTYILDGCLESILAVVKTLQAPFSSGRA